MVVLAETEDKTNPGSHLTKDKTTSQDGSVVLSVYHQVVGTCAISGTVLAFTAGRMGAQQ